MMKSIETAPKDGTVIQALIPGYGDNNLIYWKDGFVDDIGGDAGAWCFLEGEEHPKCWTDGVCWSSNEDLKPSKHPTHWNSKYQHL